MINRSVWSGRLSLPQWPAQRFGSSRSWLQLAVAIAVIGLITFILYLYVLPNSQMSEARARIAQLQQDTEALVRVNAELERQISEYSDLPGVAAQARALGMRPAASYVFFHRDAVRSAPATANSQGQQAQPARAMLPEAYWRDSIEQMRGRVADLTTPWLQRFEELTSPD